MSGWFIDDTSALVGFKQLLFFHGLGGVFPTDSYVSGWFKPPTSIDSDNITMVYR